MEQLFTAIWNALKPEPGTITIFLGAMAPLGVFMLVFWHHQRKQKESDPPQQEKLLRPAGYTLSLKLDATAEKMVGQMLSSVFFCVIGAGCAGMVAAVLGYQAPKTWAVPFGILFGLFAGLAVYFLIQTSRRIEQCQNLRLGLRGEQAVGEALHEAGDVGYRAFHDLPAGEKWNIDHVVVGTKGLFLVESKARRRKTPKSPKPKHVVKQRGAILEFPCGLDEESIPQGERNARWLTDYLAKKTGEPVNVEAIVALPGWYVETDHRSEVKAMNADYMVKFLRNQQDRIEPAQVRRIITALEEKCRTLEF